MANKIISPPEVVALAFSDGGYVAPDVVSDVDITSAIERWIRPVVGEALLEAVEGGDYATLLEEYLRPAVAAYVRLAIQPRLNVATSQLGLYAPNSSHHKAADEASRRELMRSLRTRATTLLRHLSDYMEQNKESIKEYKSNDNILNRCTLDGGFIQIF
jgi:hypothetical protein